MAGESQREILLTYLQKNHSITQPDARRNLGIENPSARVRELRALGHDIRTNIERVTASDGSFKKMARYRLYEK